MHQGQKISFVSSPVLRFAIGLEQFGCRRELLLVGITNVGNFFEKIWEIRMFGKTGKLAFAMLSDIDEFFYTRFCEKTEKLFGRFSRKSDRAKKNFHKIKSTRWLREMRGRQTPGLDGGARPGEPHHVRK